MRILLRFAQSDLPNVLDAMAVKGKYTEQPKWQKIYMGCQKCLSQIIHEKGDSDKAWHTRWQVDVRFTSLCIATPKLSILHLYPKLGIFCLVIPILTCQARTGLSRMYSLLECFNFDFM